MKSHPNTFPRKEIKTSTFLISKAGKRYNTKHSPAVKLHLELSCQKLPEEYYFLTKKQIQTNEASMNQISVSSICYLSENGSRKVIEKPSVMAPTPRNSL
ncbi:hypothetical protein TNCV_23551 [Trichonephila clavipes]|nr:hypothetical protein TNCV_23551 [Trichonephila clavipes]